MTKEGITNAAIAEWLAVESETAQGHARMALKRAARMAFLWPIEARDLVAQGRSLTELPGVGGFLSRRINEWLEKPPALSPTPPERQQFLTLTEARRILARQPRWLPSYRGDLQMHSTWSDGAATIAEMAEAAKTRGYEYIAITDHSKGLKIAGGIDERKLRRQGEEIAALNDQCDASVAVDVRRRDTGPCHGKFRVLRSIEMNLNPSGCGDMDSDALAELDLVVGSFHSSLRQTTDQTRRYLAAVENPDVQILGHPRGRIYNYRLGLTADWRRIFARAAELDKAIEVDSYPDRQDINADLLKIARAEGVRIAIDTDAHAPEQLGFVELGLAAALQARIPRDRIVNFMTADEVIAWAASLRVRSHLRSRGPVPQPA